MSELLLFLWEQATDADVKFCVDAVNCWPQGMLRRLQEIGLVVEADFAKFVPCDDCDGGHVEPVEWRDAVTELKPFIRCPEHGLRPIEPQRIRQWKIDCRKLAAETARHLLPEVSKECLDRISTGQCLDSDRDDVIELLSGIPSEATLQTRRRTIQNADSKRLAWTVDGMPPQAVLLLRVLWSSRGDVHWSELPHEAFDEGPARSPDVSFEGLKRLQKQLSKSYDKFFLVLQVSRKKQTTTLRKDPLPKRGQGLGQV